MAKYSVTLIKWQKKITANKYKGNNRTKEALALYMVLWCLKLGIATQNRDFAMMLVKPLNMSSPCSVLVKKETKQWKIRRKEERERKYQSCISLWHGMPTLCTLYAALDTELDESSV